jgi:ferric-dicitrate binding protein FerR (iron transport regulator)
VVDCDAARGALLIDDRGESSDASAAADSHVAACAACGRWRQQLRKLDRTLGDLAAADSPPPPPFERIARSAAGAARRHRRARALRRALPLAVAVACAATVTFLVTRLGHRGDERVAASGQVLDATRVVTQTLLADGARVTVASGRAIVALSDARRALIQLDSGQVFVTVPHLGTGASFVLTTDEAEVRVRGTRFDVSRDAQGTRVTVSEGTVEVQPRADGGAAFLVNRGESRLLEGLPVRRQAARAAALAAIEARDDSTTADRIRAWLATRPPDLDAAEAHALLAWKLSRDGDRAGALGSYRRALELLPAGDAPLWADNASAQLALLVERDDPRARDEAWRRYLERFPGGVHAAMARDRLSGPRAPAARSSAGGRRR